MANPRRRYIGNLPWGIKPGELRELLSDYGVVIDVAIIYSGDGRSRGFGFCEYSSREEAERLQNEGNGRLIWGQTSE